MDLWIRDSPAPRATSLNPVVPPCQRSGEHALRFDTLNSVCKVVGEPGEAVIRKTRVIESADKNTVIDRVESLGQVDEDCCTVLSVIDGFYDIV